MLRMAVAAARHAGAMTPSAFGARAFVGRGRWSESASLGCREDRQLVASGGGAEADRRPVQGAVFQSSVGGGSALTPGLSAESLSAFVPYPPHSCPATREGCSAAQADLVATEHGCVLRRQPAFAGGPARCGSRHEVTQTTRHCRVTSAMTRECQSAGWPPHGVVWTIRPPIATAV